MNEKQKQFVKEYTKDWNATQAAIRAKYSPKTAYSQGQRLLKHVEVQAAITERIEKIAMSQDEVLGRLGLMGKGLLATRIATGGKQGDVMTYDSLAALEKVGKVHAMFIDKQITTVEGMEFVEDDE